MTNKILSYTEYQNRIKNITTPEEAAAFAHELLTPMIAGMSRSAPTEAFEENEEENEQERPARAALAHCWRGRYPALTLKGCHDLPNKSRLVSPQNTLLLALF